MYDWFVNLNPIMQALIGTLFTWFLTAMGAAMVFFFKSINRKVLDGMLGFAAGVMIAASYWSLLAPAIEMAEASGGVAWIPATIGFLLGGAFLWIVDKTLPHLHLGFPMSEAEGIKTTWQRSVLLVLAITLHNIPEGLAVGVAFGALAANLPSASFAGAVALALGIGIQNFPEGTSVSVPLRRAASVRFRHLGLAAPSFVPFFFASARASFVRWLICSASCSATAARIWTVNLFASGMSQATKSTPDSISPDTKCTLRAKRSSFAMHSVAPARLAWAMAFANSGRSERLPVSTSL